MLLPGAAAQREIGYRVVALEPEARGGGGVRLCSPADAPTRLPIRVETIIPQSNARRVDISLSRGADGTTGILRGGLQLGRKGGVL